MIHSTGGSNSTRSILDLIQKSSEDKKAKIQSEVYKQQVDTFFRSSSNPTIQSHSTEH